MLRSARNVVLHIHGLGVPTRPRALLSGPSAGRGDPNLGVIALPLLFRSFSRHCGANFFSPPRILHSELYSSPGTLAAARKGTVYEAFRGQTEGLRVQIRSFRQLSGQGGLSEWSGSVSVVLILCIFTADPTGVQCRPTRSQGDESHIALPQCQKLV
ncbi:hypothetical protein NPIL_120781 [Nephila pilipes]|uniref:Uncharacterized protein n=1 Tax=Nephila pilipes TaxID=299642 RepID=A0A8X6PBV7_NEPPI|nr:hypothetical protein NPIL_120781 [Nephila pilipes]